MEQVIMEALFWKQVQIGSIAGLLIIATILSIWNLPWKQKAPAVASDKKLKLKEVLSGKKGEILLQGHLYRDQA